MDSFWKTLLGLLLFGGFVYYVYSSYAKRTPKKTKKKTSYQPKQYYPTEKLPYEVKTNLMTANERKFLFALGEYVGNRAYICPMVGLKDIFKVKAYNRKDYQTYLNKIWRKHVDFLLVTPDSDMNIICAIELDDSTHNWKSTKKRDNFKNRVFNDAGVPLIRYVVKSSYSMNDFCNILDWYFNSTESRV